LAPLPQSAILSAMNQKAVLCAVVFAAALGLAASLSALGDDSAASIAAGGLVPRRETRIVMAKEVLRISLKKIVVDYDFRNDSDQAVTTEVAFPVPSYENGFPEEDIAGQSFQDFRLWVNGKPVNYQSQATATLKGKDVTGILSANHIDIATFGHFVEVEGSDHASQPVSRDLSRLPMQNRDNLVSAGLFNGDGPDDDQEGLWTVHLQYHWTQTFPAHSIIHIRHEYSPSIGFFPISLGAIELALQPTYPVRRPISEYSAELTQIRGFCPDEPFLLGAKSMAVANYPSGDEDSGAAELSWVDFILTTANTWHRPIEDFTLILERPQPEQGGKTLVSFCSPANGKVEKLDADHFQVHLTKFVPTSELHIGFFEIAPPALDYPSATNSAPASHRRAPVMIRALIGGGILVLLSAAVFHRRRKRQAAKSQEKPRG